MHFDAKALPVKTSEGSNSATPALKSSYIRRMGRKMDDSGSNDPGEGMPVKEKKIL